MYHWKMCLFCRFLPANSAGLDFKVKIKYVYLQEIYYPYLHVPAVPSTCKILSGLALRPRKWNFLINLYWILIPKATSYLDDPQFHFTCAILMYINAANKHKRRMLSFHLYINHEHMMNHLKTKGHYFDCSAHMTQATMLITIVRLWSAPQPPYFSQTAFTNPQTMQTEQLNIYL